MGKKDTEQRVQELETLVDFLMLTHGYKAWRDWLTQDKDGRIIIDPKRMPG
jgi:hypothetical protein